MDGNEETNLTTDDRLATQEIAINKKSEDIILKNKAHLEALKKKLGGVFVWTEEDDKCLMAIMEQYQAPNRDIWDEVAAKVERNKSSKECLQRWTRYLGSPRKNMAKNRFNVDEDAIIYDAVVQAQQNKNSSLAQGFVPIPKTNQKGKPVWTEICKLLSHYNPQVDVEYEPHRIRERWHNILNPRLNHLQFTKDDDIRLYEGLKEYGTKWTLISKHFFEKTRSDIQIKNRFKTTSFKTFYSKVANIALSEQRMKKVGQTSTVIDESRKEDNSQSTTPQNNSLNSSLSKQQQIKTNSLAARLESSLARRIVAEDVPKPSNNEYFTPLQTSQILSKVPKSERRTMMKVWIERKYVPVNLTSLYRAFARYEKGLDLKSNWSSDAKLIAALRKSSKKVDDNDGLGK
ncbi:hypothetical protein CTEN210_11480 [Chaetoceros tenuissimus]|uniref:Myb-like DNA-binding domain containing protein n=1 Tax=Chaetoceros tenuissimus TaxID=426638 RepID=A0AAD3D2P0_9STRA|nr:hypothetical protein CTEN210_11480 [Chaetoceros tenuissimus]